MTPYRQETSAPGGQSVRFYKFVALTFLLLTIVLLVVIVFSSSKKATIVITTKPEVVDVSFAVGINLKDQTNNIDGAVTSTAVSITKNYKPTGTKQVTGAATGKMVLHNEGLEDQVLIATTRLQTSEGAIFRLKDKVKVPAQGEVEVAVYFDTKIAVSSTGVGKLTVPGLNADKQKIIYATNDKPISSIKEVGVLSSEDLKKAEDDIKEALLKQGKEELSQKFEGMVGVYSLNSLVVETKDEIGSEIEDFTMTAKAVVTGAFYKQDIIDIMAKRELTKQLVGDAELLKTTSGSATVSLLESSSSTMSAKLNISYSGSVELNPESKQIQKDNFYGKTEEEARRYLLSLDHVKSVEIDFSPAWTGTIPSIPDHVSVVVKNVE